MYRAPTKEQRSGLFRRPVESAITVTGECIELEKNFTTAAEIYTLHIYIIDQIYNVQPLSVTIGIDLGSRHAAAFLTQHTLLSGVIYT